MNNKEKRLTRAEKQAVCNQITRLSKFSSEYADEMIGYYKKLLEIYG